MNSDDLNIKIYTLEEIKSEGEKTHTLTPEEIEIKLLELKDKLPHTIISELEQNLKKARVTEEQFKEIIKRVMQASKSNFASELERINQRLNELDNSVSFFVKYLENEFQKPSIGIGSDIISTSILLKWVEYLLSRTGEEYLGEVLKVYVELGWIDEALRNKMLLLARVLHISTEVTNFKLEAKDHIQSLIFIEKLKAVNLVNL
ncbi:MAG: FlaD/FlaE family flagellar protein [Methanocellales archaeon]